MKQMVIQKYNDNERKEELYINRGVASNDEVENIIRPKILKDYIGQEDIKSNLKIFVQASKKRGEALDHHLFYGPPGLGKTTLAMVLAHEMGSQLRITSGPSLEKSGDLAAILSNLEKGDVLFIDEIHRLRRPVEEVLYSAMEDFFIDLIMGKGPSARTMRLDIPRFTLIAATTQVSLIASPLRDRFGHVERLRYYKGDELEQILIRSASILRVSIEPQAVKKIAASCRWTPRIANRLLRRLRDFAEIEGDGIITQNIANTGLRKLNIDDRGLDFSDQHYLRTLCEKFNGGPVGVSTLASAIGEEIVTLEDVIEPFLIREGLLLKEARGRKATNKAFLHLSLDLPHSETMI